MKPPRIGSCYRHGWVLSGVCGVWGILMHVLSGDTRVERLDDLGDPCPCQAADRYARTERLR